MIILTLLSIILSSVNVNEACTNSTSNNCNLTDPSAVVIRVFGVAPSSRCVVVQIGNTKYMYDPVMINYVWITLVNPGKTCYLDMASFIQNFSPALNLLPSQQIIVLSVTADYVRLILVQKSCLNCMVYPINSTFESNLQNTASIQIFPIYNDLNPLGPYCLNGGIIDTTYQGAGYKCICTIFTPFTGPACEYMERSLDTSQYFFNVFQNNLTINILFSFYSNGINGNFNILMIKSPIFQRIIEITVMETSIFFYADGKNTSQLVFIDNQSWFDFNVIITRQTATMIISGTTVVTKVLSMTSTATADFRQYYLVLNAPSNHQFKVSLKNLYINSRLIDFSSLDYTSSCQDRCRTCVSNQICICKPFVSKGSEICASCKFGYQLIGTACLPSKLTFSQMPSSSLASTPVEIPYKSLISSLDFGFQTLSVNGNLISVSLSQPLTNILIQIINTNLALNIATLPITSINYNVSDGISHTVSLLINPITIQLILDNNFNYTTSSSNWITVPVNSISLQSLSLGVMQLPFNSTFNTLTTCFSQIQLNNGSSIPTSISMPQGPNMLTGCSSGPNCSTPNISCPPNQVCNDSQWQNTKCLCIPNYSFANINTCISTECLNNTCGNGACSYNNINNTYTCNCFTNYYGSNCQYENSSTSTAGLWWIAILIVLVLLLIIIIILLVFCCCCPKASTEIMAIGKINENAAVYNEQAGECDYDGPPINFNLLKNALNNKPQSMLSTSTVVIPDFTSTKDNMDKNNNDLILDCPLEYGFEGYESETASFSPIGSIGGDSAEEDGHDINEYIEQ